MQPDSALSISAVEAYPMDAFSVENVTAGIAEAQKGAASASEYEAAEATIELEVRDTPPGFPRTSPRWWFANGVGARSSRASRLR